MKQLLLIMLFCFLGSSETRAVTDGQEIFDTLECFKCHDPQYKKLGPPLHVIAISYNEKESLLNYFYGRTKSIVEPKRAKIMKVRLRQIQKLSDLQKSALADFIMSFKKLET